MVRARGAVSTVWRGDEPFTATHEEQKAELGVVEVVRARDVACAVSSELVPMLTPRIINHRWGRMRVRNSCVVDVVRRSGR